MLLHVLESIVLELMHDGSGHVSGEHRLTTHPCTEYIRIPYERNTKYFNACADSVYDTKKLSSLD